jgi:hypothetical protein
MGHYNIEDDDILQDGQSVRVPMFAMDSLQREVAGLSRPLAQHQPAFATDTKTVLDDDFLADAEAARAEAYETYDQEISQAWMRDEDRVVERDPEGRETGTYTKRRRKVTRRDRFGRVQAEYEHEPDKDDWEVAGPLADGVDIYDAYGLAVCSASGAASSSRPLRS